MKRFGLAGLVAGSMLSSSAFAKEGMPQLNFANPMLTAQVIWGALIFFVFYLLVSRWGLPQVSVILEARARTIADDLDSARAAKLAADNAVEELNAARRRAQAESQAAIAEATAKSKAEAAARNAEQEARLEAQLAQSEAQIARARAAAMSAIRQVATETAEAVLAKVTDGRAETWRAADAVSQIIAERGLAA